MNDWGFYFSVKINFESQGCGVEDRAAISASAQVALYFTRNLRCKPPL
jgi:hypothetical protein